MLVAIALFGVPSAIIAHFKGFKPWWWLLAWGIIGLIVVSCLASAKEQGIPAEESTARAVRANKVAAGLGGSALVITFISLMVGIILIV